MSDRNPATAPADPIEDLLTGATQLTPTTPPPPKDAPKSSPPSVVLRLVPSPDSSSSE